MRRCCPGCCCTCGYRCPNVWAWWPPQPPYCPPPPPPPRRLDVNVGRAIQQAREALR